MPCGRGVQESHGLAHGTGEAPVPSPSSLHLSPEVHKDKVKLDQAFLTRAGEWRAWLMKRDGKSLSCLGQQNQRLRRIELTSVYQQREGVTITRTASTVTPGCAATLARQNSTERADRQPATGLLHLR